MLSGALLLAAAGPRVRAQGWWPRGLAAAGVSNLPGPWTEPTSPALAARFLFTAPAELFTLAPDVQM